ncbi:MULTISPECIES: peptidylprolyl isomerase [Planococcus]|uniref:peptidylprolyl isomerase n=1 Tax=Planococcus faecalis TaxID=1598147 RepID=A0ABM6IVD0_9BACL|nr:MULTISPECIES: peptidylprolyl isomerase [Planococcus]AQU80528.1 foldase [Planococcus faecalis]MDJ0330180.1 peptidylprolyl isomerase [Planococcus sp. S3-L1]OHX52108.1 foldase [Planococcus faecalis]
MKKLLYIGIGVLAASAIFVMVAFSGDDSVASVGDKEITKEALYDKMVASAGAATLDAMISNEVVNQEAEKADIKVTQEELDAEMAVYEESYGGAEALEQALASSGMSIADLEDEMKIYLKVEKIIGPDINITDEQVSTYFEENKESFEQPSKVAANHILVGTQEEADEVKAKLDDGDDFAELAAAYSTDTSNADNGGALGEFGAGEMAAEFEAAAFSMKVDEISEPVETEYGFHIIQVTGKTDAADANLEDSKEQIKETLFDEALNTKYAEWLAEKIESYDIVNTLTK